MTLHPAALEAGARPFAGALHDRTILTRVAPAALAARTTGCHARSGRRPCRGWRIGVLAAQPTCPQRLGDVCEEDRQQNERAVTTGERVLSSYRLGNGQRVWILTEADRSVTTILLPDEY